MASSETFQACVPIIDAKKIKKISPSFHVQFCKRGTKKENQRKNTGEFKMWDVGLMGIWKKKYKKNAVNQI